MLTPTQRSFVETLSSLIHCNPFLPERAEFERRLLGNGYVKSGPRVAKAGSFGELQQTDPNLLALDRQVESAVETLLGQTHHGSSLDNPELSLYEDLVSYLLYRRYHSDLDQAIREHVCHPTERRPIEFWQRYLDDYHRFLGNHGRAVGRPTEPHTLLAFFFQVRRAMHNIFDCITGNSAPVAELRASVWQSIFTHDMRRYRRVLFRHMGDITTLVTGPSGTGKELVARAVGLSRFIPFDPGQKRFTTNFASSFRALNLSALSPTLIESALFGHAAGAFTGAIRDQTGWLEDCSAAGSIFLDEIGDLDQAIQVKLLRVLETRQFQRLGETKDYEFCGKIIAATNRNLTAEMQAGRFREDLYYRLCADQIITPSLREQLADCPDDLGRFVRFIVGQSVREEADSLADEILAWIEKRLGRDYPWPGNIRELAQCVRNVMIRKEYIPVRPKEGDPVRKLMVDVENGALAVDDLLRRYCTLVFAKTGSYEEAARRLKLDRRTVKSKVDLHLLREMKDIHRRRIAMD